MFKTLITIFLLIQNLSSACGPGCLKCSLKDECIICDQNHNYIMKGKSCIRGKIPNCHEQNDQSCYNCSEGYLLDQKTQKCIIITERKKIDNCIKYNELNNCSQCYKNFYLKNNKCIRVKNEISNCIINLNEDKCLECDPSFILNLEGTECEKTSSLVDDCVGYMNSKCSECDDDYFYNENSYLEKIQENVDWKFFNRTKYRMILFRTEMNLCSKKSIINCVFFEKFDKCKQCKENYFINKEGACTKNPDSVIDNCFEYKNSLKCKNCEKGFYLKFPDKCDKNIEIPNCVSYSRNSTSTKCESCEKNYYLLNNECKIRSNIIKFCLLYKIEKDGCEFCEKHKIVIKKGLECANKVSNCLKYDNDTNDCKICNEKHILKNQQCKLGTIEGCKNYHDSDTDDLEICTFCENDRYLNNNKCEKHDEIVGCILYDFVQKNFCLQCNKNSFLIYHKNFCKEVDTKIDNCENYSKKTTCEKCKENYFLENNKCFLIPESSNCDDFSNFSGCSKCKDGFILSYEKCFSPSFLFTDNCQEKNYRGGLYLHQGGCDVCSKNSIPYNIKNNYYCLESKRVDEVLPDLISHCKNYYKDGLNIYCSKCENEYILKNNSCILINSCNESVIPFIFDNSYEFKKMKECKDLIEGCEIVVPNNKNPNLFECSKCKNTYNENIIDFFEDNTNFNIFKNVQNLEENIITENPVSFFPRIICKNKNNNLYINDNIINDCYYYIKLGISRKLGCIRCKNGYKGKVEKLNNEFFIKECVVMDKCNNSTKGGISKNMDKLFSCQVCKNITEIPTLFINSSSEFDGIKGIQTYDNDFNISEHEGESVKCLRPEKIEFKITGDFSIPENCSHLIYNINSIKDSSNSNLTSNIDKKKIAVFCTSCKTGYKKTISRDILGNEIEDFTGECKKIENCDGLLWFNSCSKCKEGYIWKYDINKGVDYSTCIEFEGENCIAGEYKFPEQTFCSLCKKGYIKNLDGKCVQYLFKDCNKYFNFLNIGKKDLQTKIFFYFYLNGCQDCSTNDFNLFYEKENLNICLYSDYTLNLPENTNYIKNCSNYYNFFPPKCYKCKVNFILEESGYECIASIMKNCEKIRKINMKCTLCSENYIVINGVCQKKNIENCIEYLNTDTDTQKCTKCKNGFYEKNYKCEMGDIKFCEIFEGNGINCKKCFHNFILISNNVGKNYCVPSMAKENCLEPIMLNNGTLECLKCTNNNYLYENDENFMTNSCIHLDNIQNCLTYDVKTNVIHSSLKCIECKSNFYLEKNTCKNQIIIQNCLNYSKSSPKCEICLNEYYLNDLKNKCIENPKGIQNCQEYYSLEKCKLCKKNYFLFNNTCIKVINKIDNCSVYYDEKNCKVCERGFLIKSGKCLETNITNCVYFKDINNCKECLGGFYLKKDEEKKKTYCEGKNIQMNCSDYNIEKQICEKCDKNYFFNKTTFICEEISKKIDNCEYYIEDGICSQCKEKFILSFDQLVCKKFIKYDTLIDKNCKIAFQTNKNHCQICLQGYYKDRINKKCVSCNDLNCAFCNPEEPKECLICKDNAYQNYKGECISIQKKVTDDYFGSYIQIWLQSCYIFIFIIF